MGLLIIGLKIRGLVEPLNPKPPLPSHKTAVRLSKPHLHSSIFTLNVPFVFLNYLLNNQHEFGRLVVYHNNPIPLSNNIKVLAN